MPSDTGSVSARRRRSANAGGTTAAGAGRSGTARTPTAARTGSAITRQTPAAPVDSGTFDYSAGTNEQGEPLFGLRTPPEALAARNRTEAAARRQAAKPKPAPAIRREIDNLPALARDADKLEWKWVPGQLWGPNGVKGSDVDQGRHGDCYMMAAFAAIAERQPQIIENAIHDNGDGTYVVTLYDWQKVEKHGMEFWELQPVEIEIDGRLPVLKGTDGTRGHYANSTEKGELWPAILEKAFAVLHDGRIDKDGKQRFGYDAIEDGNPGDVMEALTGRETQKYDGPISADKIRSYISGGGFVTLMTTKDSGKNLGGTKFVAPHTYAVFDIKGTGKDTIITLYNPWGEEGDRWGLPGAKFDITIDELKWLDKMSFGYPKR